MSYVELIKFRYHISFLTVIFAVLFFANQFNLRLLHSVCLLYVSFNVLLYGGIYTLNDIQDLKSDSEHPKKRNRPIASGRVGLKRAWLFSSAMILLGLISAKIIFGPRMFSVYSAILLLNLFYSFFARNVLYLDLLINSATHPLRFLMGVMLVGRNAPTLHLIAYLFFSAGLSSLRREVERDIPGWEARRTLTAYSPDELRYLQWAALAAIVVCFAAIGFASRGFYSTVITTYLVVGLGARLSVNIRSCLREVWTN